MPLSLNTLQAPKRLSNMKRKRVGRGDSSGHGSYSGRGQKGQSSRSGVGGLRLKGLRRRLMSIPKLGGFKSIHAKMEIVNVGDLEKAFAANATVDPSGLVNAGLVSTHSNGVKILAKGDIKKALTISHCHVSAAAKQKIEAAGGKVA